MAAENEQRRVVSGPWVRASKIEPAAVKWLWEERIPQGMLSLVAGRPGGGKSLFAVLVAAMISRTGAGVVIASREDPLREVIRPRLEVAGADLDLVDIWTPTNDLEKDKTRLSHAIVELDAKIVFIDPAPAFIRQSIHNDQAVRIALTPLARIADETGCSIVLISHLTKPRKRVSHPLDAIGGSGAGLVGASRAVFLFGKSPDDPDVRVLAAAKANLGSEPVSLAFAIETVDDYRTGSVARLVLLGETDVSATDLATNGSDDTVAPAAKREEASAFLRDQLANGAKKPAAEIKLAAEEAGLSWRTVRRAADELEVVRPKGGPGAKWSLPKLVH